MQLGWKPDKGMACPSYGVPGLGIRFGVSLTLKDSLFFWPDTWDWIFLEGEREKSRSRGTAAARETRTECF